MGFLSGYTKRWKITVDATKVPSTQTDFPTYVDLSDMPASFWSTVANGGGDIRVTQSDGETERAREVVSCDTGTDTGELHFLANSIDGTTDTDFYIYANGTSSDYAVTDTYGRNNVWGGYSFVSHDGGGTDSTGNYSPTANNGVTAGGATGKIGDATTFDGTNDNFSFSNVTYGADATWQMWLKTGDTAVVMPWSTQDSSVRRFSVFLNNAGSDLQLFARNEGSGADINALFNTTTHDINDDTWNLIHVLVNNGGDAFLYVNGDSEDSDTSGSGWGGFTQTGTTYIGGEVEFDRRYVNGDFDEVRLRGDDLSSNWITTEYNNQNSPSTFYSVGTMEEDGGGTARNALAFAGGM